MCAIAARRIRSVLIADSSEAERLNLKSLLIRAGYLVTVAMEESDTVALVMARRPDAVIIADKLGEASGAAIIRRLKDDPAAPGFLAALTASAGDVRTLTGYYHDGVDRVIQKPVDETALLKALEEMCAPSPSGEARAILSVVADADFNLRLREAAQRLGVRLDIAKNGSEGLKMAGGADYCLLLAGQMAGIDGLTYVSILKSAERTKTVPVALVYPSLDDALRCAAAEKGAENVIALGARPDDIASGIEAIFEARRLAALGRARVMAVEDSPIVCKLYSQFFAERGFDYLVEMDPSRAIEAARGFIPDLILMDANMPGVNGFDLTRQMKAQPQFENTRIIMITSDTKKESVIRALEAGAVDFLTKPFDEEVLLARMRAHLANKRLFDDLTRAYREMESLKNKLELLSITDGLTGLYNHRHFYERLAAEMDAARRSRAPLSLLLMDLDHFKKFNDTYGHRAGDKALKSVADTLEAATGAQDTLARYGGEEFAVILPGAAAERALKVAEAIRAAVEGTPLNTGGKTLHVSVSIGAAAWNGALTEDQLVEKADTALYQSKAAGRNRVTLAD